MGDGRYHHGDLPTALLRSVREIVAAEGVGGVSVRAVARRAGVSHAAPAHHFGDRAGLLAALAAEGFDRFVEDVHVAREGCAPDATAADVMAAIGRAYVDFGLANPEYYVVMFRPEMVDGDHPELDESGGQAFAALVATVRGCLAPGTADDVVLTVSMVAWSTVHGFVSLSHDVPMMKAEYIPVLAGMADPVVDTLLAGLRAHPAWVGDDAPAAVIDAALEDPVVETLIATA